MASVVPPPPTAIRRIGFLAFGVLCRYVSLFLPVKLYEKKEQWQDLYDLAADCAEGLKDEQGQPHDTGRAMARGVMRQLADNGIEECRT